MLPQTKAKSISENHEGPQRQGERTQIFPIRRSAAGTQQHLMLPFCLPGSSHLSIEIISAPNSGLSRHATIGRVGSGAVAVGLACLLSAPFVWRCPSSLTITPFPHPSHRTGHADFPHPALGLDITPSPTPRCARARSDVRDRSARKGARVDKSRPCFA
jgi:hypothetical protein